MRLNLGCGDDRREGYVNIDLRSDVADLNCDVTKLGEFEDGSVDEILALDILEHFPSFRSLDILAEWNRVLKDDGVLTLRVPNMYQLSRVLVSRYEQGKYEVLPSIIRNIYGGHRWGNDGEWDAHHTGWTPAELHVQLEMSGFQVLSDDEALNNTVIARKSGNSR